MRPSLLVLSGLLGLLAVPAAAAPAASARVGVVGPASDLEDAWDVGDGRGVTIWGVARLDYRFRPFRTATDAVATYHPLRQSFRFSVRNDGPRARVSFESSFRGRVDIGQDRFLGEVLYAFVDVAPTDKHGFVRFGRQILTTSGASGLTRFDGVRARLTVWRLGFEAFAGVPLRTRAFFSTDEDHFEVKWGRDWTYGAALFLAGHRATQLRIGFQERFNDAALSRRHLTLDFHQGIRSKVNVRTNFAVDLLQQRFSEVLVGLEGRPIPMLRLLAEYEHWQPSFDADEIWSVFATDPYDTVRGRAVLTPVRQLQLWVGGGVQILPESVTRDNVPYPETGNLSGTQRFGVRIAPTPWLSFRVTEQLVHGAAGMKLGLSASAQVSPLQRRLSVQVRGDYQRYGFDLQPNLEGNYGNVAVDVEGRPVPWMRARVSVDGVISPWLADHVQVTASVDFLLGVKVRKDGTVAGSADLSSWQPALLAASRTLGKAPWQGNTPGLTGGIGVAR